MGKIARLFLFAIGVFFPALAVAGPVRGSVVDTTGAALPRAFVRLIDASGHERQHVLSDAAGRFTVDAGDCDACSIEASLSGFATASAAIGIPQARVTLTLSPSPVSDAIVVTATREAAPADQVGASVTVFTADDIARRGTVMVSDVIRETPGLALIQAGGRGGVTSLFMRGGDSSYTKVLLDGIPLNEPGGAFNFGTLTSTNLGRVEVARGAESALFGSDAMSGVLQLVTARGAVGPHPVLSATVESGSYATRRVDAAIRGAAHGWDYSVGGASNAADNRVPNNRMTESTVSWSAGGALARSLTLRTVGRVESGRTGTPGQTAFGRPDLDAFFDHRDSVAGVALEHRASGAWIEHLSYGFTRSRQESTNLTADPPYVPAYGDRVAPFAFSDYTYDSENRLRRHFLSYQGDGRINAGGRVAQLVTVLADWDGERATLTDRMAQTSIEAARNNIGVSLQHQFVGAWGSLATSVRAEHNESFGSKWAPRISGAFVIHHGRGAWGDLAVKANAGRGVKEPTILQSFSPNVYYRGNPDLLPEIATTRDVGFTQRLASDRARIEAVYFDNRYENQISTRTTDPATFAAEYFNIGDTTARGLELSGEASIASTLRLSGGYTFTDSEIVKSTSDFSAVLKAGNSAFRRPRHSAFARAAYTRGRVKGDLDGVFVGRRVDSDFASLAPPIESSGHYWVWNASASVALTPAIDAYGRVENLANADYMEPLGYQAWRRTVHAGLRVRF